MPLEVAPGERAAGHQHEVVGRRGVDRGAHQGPADPTALDLVRHARVHQHQPVVTSLVGELGQVAVDRDLEASPGRVVDGIDGRVRPAHCW